MPMLKKIVPKYRKHRATGQAVVSIQGRDHYLGPWQSRASKAEYDRLIGEWLSAGRPTVADRQQCDLTIIELVASYWRFAGRHYIKNGKQTSELGNVKDALRPVKKLYGHTLASDFGPLALKATRQTMIDGGLARQNINARVGRIRRMFKWAASEELVPASVFQALGTVSGLRKGRTEAHETAPVAPVDSKNIEAALPHLSLIVADMVRFQRLTGCRPEEVCIIRPYDLDRSEEVWEYRPESHKGEHHGRERIIFIGPKGQDVLRPYLLRSEKSYCFSAAESENRRRAEQHENRRTPLSRGNRPGSKRKRRSKRTVGDRYDTHAYRRAIHRACDKAGIERWSPNRLRHSAATAIRKQFGLEAAQVTLGHAAADVTQIYAERDLAKAASIMLEIG